MHAHTCAYVPTPGQKYAKTHMHPTHKHTHKIEEDEREREGRKERKNSCVQAQWSMPIIPACKEAEPRDHWVLRLAWVSSWDFCLEFSLYKF